MLEDDVGGDDDDREDSAGDGGFGLEGETVGEPEVEEVAGFLGGVG